MATTNADGYVSTAFRGDGNSVCVLDVTHEYTAGQLAINEVIKIGEIPKGAVYLDGYIVTDDLDSNATPLLSLEVGDGDDADGLADGTTIGQAAGLVRFNGAYMTNRTALTAAKTIRVVTTAAAATAAAGTVRVVLSYYTP